MRIKRKRLKSWTQRHLLQINIQIMTVQEHLNLKQMIFHRIQDSNIFKSKLVSQPQTLLEVPIVENIRILALDN